MPSNIVSNSEVDSFQRCQRMHWYAYGLGLSPKAKNVPIKHGILGHSAFEAYYKAMKAELPRDECIQTGLLAIADAPSASGDVMGMVTKRFLEYVKHYENEPFRVIDVEGVYSIPLPNGLTYALTVDLLVEMTEGEYKGEQVVIDTKWCYYFWTVDDAYMHPQIPKYIGALRMLGANTRAGLINMVRWRDIKTYEPEQVFRRLPVKPTQTRLDNIMQIQCKISLDEILKRRQMSKVEWHDNHATPTLNNQNCKNCFFKQPCSQELDGIDPTTTLAIAFENRSYGYSEEKLRRNLE